MNIYCLQEVGYCGPFIGYCWLTYLKLAGYNSIGLLIVMLQIQAQ